ncbi:reverse transcriptase N-terminal domain-containing protein [Nostoc sp. LEGE 12447]|uniref:group II intron reverse transcriptase/maturase n=1 Tax=Nostoc sp. LEGE 12447 TaxID=1828640 RepID=UPI001883D767|nr:reverse transcriptase domain-containing protein [Nostoc sp. LEGE 12447]MBE9001568.1 reverse transcriptase N-terminal domain-containing protein [Nostoc sp. LEGE 12447]
MVRHMTSNSDSELWKSQPWKKLRKNLFRLQCRLWKAVRVGDRKRANNLQKLILKSRSARLLAIRQVTQLNKGKKTAGVDGKASLTFQERFDLDNLLKTQVNTWTHSKLREIPIPKKDGTMRILKVPTMKDRAWQCIIKYSIEPAHEAIFHERSYGFRPGRSTHDVQKYLFDNLRSKSNGKDKIILEMDIEKCFDRINHNHLMSQIIAPKGAKLGLWKCLKAGVNPEFPEQGTPQGGVCSPVLANIALHGIEAIHKSVRYADDMVFIFKKGDNQAQVFDEITEFLRVRGLNIKSAKTRFISATDGFNFLGWQFRVQKNGKFRCTPSEDNYLAFRKKVKAIVNNSNYGALVKSQKLSPIIRGWRNYHRYCKMDGSRFTLWFTRRRTWNVFNKESKLNRYQTDALIDKAFPAVPYSEHKHFMVKGDASPFNGNLVYWSKRQSKHYDGATAKALKKQDHSCGHCGLKFADDEDIHLHHVDRDHDNWKSQNLLAIHQSCHQYIHMSK